MPPKKRNTQPKRNSSSVKGIIEGAGEVVAQPITHTLEKNYMPYAMSVIMSRAIPEIDGFKPSHRKLLFTMYKMALLGSARTKSANIVGQTMKLNPHGDSAIYDTMVRLSRGYEALLHPYIDSKGNFGKYYSRDMAWAASRYTEARLDAICQELFRDIDKDTVDFVDNYDNTMKEPTLLPASYPSVLVNANTGIAVGMASSISPFNLEEVCQTTIAYIKNQDHDIATTLLAPDFPGGGQIVYDKQVIDNIYQTGRGSIRVRSRYTYDPSVNCIDITQIPPTTTIEVIVEKIVDLVKQGKIKEISDIRDETGLEGLKITIDLKRGTDPEKLMQRLYKMTTLEDSFSCNFNVLVAGVPRVMGIRQLLEEWVAFRIECVRRRTSYDLNKKQDKLHLLKGLQAILLDIDKAVFIIRNTEEETEVVPNLMVGFHIDQIQADYVAEIKLRHLNREYILKRTEEITQLDREIAVLQEILASKEKIKQIIITELINVMKKYAQPRHSMLLYADEIEEINVEEQIPNYPVHLFFTKEGYFKKITPQSLRMSGEQKLKEGDKITEQLEATNHTDLLFFTNRATVYKTKASEFSDTKASVLGDYVAAKLGMREDESAVSMIAIQQYEGFIIFLFENGKIVKIDIKAYLTKTNRKKLIGAYSDKSPLFAMFYCKEECEILLTTTEGRMLLVNTAQLQIKTTRSAQGVACITLKRNKALVNAKVYQEGAIANADRYRKNIPSIGVMPPVEEPEIEQLKL